MNRASHAVVLLAAAAALALPALAAGAHAQGADGAQCPAADLGRDCAYHVTRTVDVGDIMPHVIRIDETGHLYVASQPTIGSDDTGHSYVRIYDSADKKHRLIKEIRFNGTNSRVTDMEINAITNEIHVVHLWGVGSRDDGWSGEELDSKGKASLTTISTETYRVVKSIQLRHYEIMGGGNTATIERYNIDDLALHQEKNAAFIATRSGPILVVDTANSNSTLLNTVTDHTVGGGGGSGTNWNAYIKGAPASALAVDEENDKVYAAVRVGHKANSSSHVWGIATLDFFQGGDRRLTSSYQQDNFLKTAENPAPSNGSAGIDYNSHPWSADVRAASLRFYEAGKLFALYENHTVLAYGLSAGVPQQQPDKVNVSGPPAPALNASSLADPPPGGNRIYDLALDAERGLLYASVHDWAYPRVAVADAMTHASIAVASTSSQTRNMGVDPRSGALYVLPTRTPHAYVIEASEKHDLQAMIDNAESGAVVAVPPGIYDDAVVDIGKPLTLTSETGRPGAAVLTGNSRIEIMSDNVTIRGLSFEDTGCLPGFAGALVKIRTGSDGPLDNIAIENNAFRDTCHAAIQQEGIAAVANIAIRHNSFESIGLKIPLGRTDPVDTGGEGEHQLMHGAIGLAYHPSQHAVSGTISHNRINGTSAAGIRVFNATDMTIENNYIASTPASAIGLAHGPVRVSVTGNTIANANSEPDLDYLDGVNGSGAAGYYREIGHYRHYLGMPQAVPTSATPAPDAAINVWANGRNVTVAGNTISGSDGAFTACTGLCAFESGGPVRAAQECRDDRTGLFKPFAACSPNEQAKMNRTVVRNMLLPEEADASTIRFNGNIVYAAAGGGSDNNGVLIRSHAGAGGPLDATGNYFVGLDAPPGGGLIAGRVDISQWGNTSHAGSGPRSTAYQVASTFPVGDIQAMFIEVGRGGSPVYVGTNPGIGSKETGAAVYAYNSGHDEAGRYELPGPVGRIIDMEVDDATGRLYVLHRMHADAPRGQAGVEWRVKVTALDQNANATAVWDGSPDARHGRDVAISMDMAVGGNRVFVANLAPGDPIAVLNGSTLVEMNLTEGDKSRAAAAAGRIVGVAVDASGGRTLGYAVTRDAGGQNTSITTVRFGGGGDGAFQQAYTMVNKTGVHDGRIGVRDMVVDSQSKKLFVLWDYQRNPQTNRSEINQTVSMYSLDESGIPVSAETLREAGPVRGFERHGDGVFSIALDRDRGVLHAVVRDSTDPRMVSYSSSNGSMIHTTSLSDQPAAVAADGQSGRVYASPSWRPNVYVIDLLPVHRLQHMIDNAPSGGVVEVRPGVYDNAVLTIDKPLTLTSPTGRAGAVGFTGLSRIHVEADGVAIRGLSFEDTDCLPGLAASLVEIGMRPGNHSTHMTGRSDVTVENSAFRNTCHAAIQQEGWGRMDNIVIRDNRFEGIGLKAAAGRTAPIDTDGEDEFVHTHGAIGLAYHPGQDPVSNSVISGNTILGTSAAGIRVFNADNVAITGNDIRDTPASGIGLSHASRNSHVSGNTIAGANSEPDFDYLDGISGSGAPGYYREITREYDYDMEKRKTKPVEPPTPDAAVKVWANSANISVTGNAILGSGGAFVACAGTCASESDGIVHPNVRNILDPASYDAGGANRIVFNWNMVAADNDRDGAELLANNATGMLDATRNYYPGYDPGDDQVRDASTVDRSAGALKVVNVTVPNLRPGSVLVTGQTVTIHVTMSGNVTVETDSGKRPTLELDNGGIASYAGAPFPDRMLFHYTVMDGQATDGLDYASHDALRLNGAAIDGVPGALALTLPLPGGQGSLGATSDLSVNRKIQAMIDAAANGTAASAAVVIPSGNHTDEVIEITSPMNVTAEPGAVLTGNSRVTVQASANGSVVLSGLVFRNLACYENGGAVLAVRPPPGAGAPAGAPASRPVVIADTVFDGTCTDAVAVLPATAAAGSQPAPPPGRGQPGAAAARSSDSQAPAAAAPASRLLITGNTFRDIGANARDGGGPAAPAAAAIRLGLPSALGNANGSGTAHVENSIVSSNYMFGSSGPAVEAAASRNVDIVGNHIEDAGSAAIRIMANSTGVSVSGNTVINASAAGVDVWADSSGIVIMGNRISESRGALSVCAGECTAGDGTRMSVEPGQAQREAVRFHHNVLHESNKGGKLVTNNAPPSLLDATRNYYPGYEPARASFANASHAPAMPAGSAPHRIGSLMALTDLPYLDGVSNAAAMREAVERFGLEQVESGGNASIELVQADLRLAAPLDAARGIATGIDDDRHYPVLHNQILWMRDILDREGREAALAAVLALESPQEHYPFMVNRTGHVQANGANATRVDVVSPLATAGSPGSFRDALRMLEAEPNSAVWRNYSISNFVREGTPIESKRSLISLYDFGNNDTSDDLVLGAGYYPHPVKFAVGPSTSPSLAAVREFANASGLVLASPGSTAADLALRDSSYRMVPNDMHRASRLADIMTNDSIRKVVALVQNDAYGNSTYDLFKKEFVARSGGSVMPQISFSASIAAPEWGPVIDKANFGLAAASMGSGGSSGAAVLYIGSDLNYVAAAAEAARYPALGDARWYATELAGSRAVAEDPAALDMAVKTRLAAVAFAVDPNKHTRAVDAAIAAHPHGEGVVPLGHAHAAYDAVRLLASALAGGGGDRGGGSSGGANASSFAAGLHGLAANHTGALGSDGIAFDTNGDLVQPSTFSTWTVPGPSRAWTAQPPAAPSVLLCAADLARGTLPLGDVRIGNESAPQAQTITNNGTLPLKGVVMNAGEWSNDLPANVTEFRAGGGTGTFSPITANASLLAQGETLMPGLSLTVEHKVNLRGTPASSAPAGPMMQNVTYTVSC